MIIPNRAYFSASLITYILSSLKSYIYTNEVIEYSSVTVLKNKIFQPVEYKILNPMDKHFNLHIDMSSVSNYESIFWYPIGKNWCKIKIDKITYISINNKRQIIDVDKLFSNAAKLEKGWFLFETFHPFFQLKITNIKSLDIKWKLNLISRKYIENKFINLQKKIKLQNKINSESVGLKKYVKKLLKYIASRIRKNKS